MDSEQPFPWPGFVLALTGSLGVLLTSQSLTLAGVIALLWIGSLFLDRQTQVSAAQPSDRMPLTRDGIRDLIEHSGIPLMMLDKTRIIMANSAMREVLGGHVMGQDARVALRHPTAISLLNSEGGGNATIKGIASPKSIYDMQVTRIDERYALVELLNKTSEADISRAHTDFVANASHELRTPLASIIGYIETLDDSGEDIDPKTRKKFYGTVLREGRRMQSLVSDLMSLSRVEAEKHDVPDDFVDFAKIAKRASAESGLPEDRARVELELDDGPFLMQGDERQLEQLVRNLVDNALKYGDDDKPITVRLKDESDNRLIFSVADRGVGIAPEHLPHLTRRFYRTDPGRSQAAGGTGLGLAIVKHIVERHRGRLDITSQQGQGTIVTVKLPLAAETIPQAS